MMRMPVISLYQAPWKTLSESPTFPGFFMGKIFVYGYPSDTFVKLPVSEIYHFNIYNCLSWRKYKCLFGSTGLGERCCLHQWVEPWSLLVHWPPANTVPAWSFSKQWNQPGADCLWFNSAHLDLDMFKLIICFDTSLAFPLHAALYKSIFSTMTFMQFHFTHQTPDIYSLLI